MSILIIAEHDNSSLKPATLNSVTAAQAIGGDIGINSGVFEHRFDSGIQFLASGVYYNNVQSKKALVFEHTKSKGLLTWEYVNIGDL